VRWRVFDCIQKHLVRRRRYASFFQGSCKTGTELNVARCLLESMALTGESAYRNLRPVDRDQDPPDCLADDPDGQVVALEVTELVSPEAIKATKRGPPQYWDWRADEVRRLLDHRVEEKDKKAFKGGPYSQKLVLVHTAEPILDSQFVSDVLREHVAPRPRQLSGAYFVLRYEAGLKRCPYFRIRFD
jgi:hypothetical protein